MKDLNYNLEKINASINYHKQQIKKCNNITLIIICSILISFITLTIYCNYTTASNNMIVTFIFLVPITAIIIGIFNYREYYYNLIELNYFCYIKEVLNEK